MSHDDELDADFDAFAAALRADLAPVATSPARAAATRDRAHAALRRASAPPAARARAHLVFVIEASASIAAGAMYVLWTVAQLWPH